jgi:ribosomal protein L11 methyltransferase
MNYIELDIEIIDAEIGELIIAELSEIGFTGFDESENMIKAFIGEKDFNEEELQSIIQKYNLQYKKNIVENQNWNELWESNFQPVIVDDFVAVRANFHYTIKNVEHEIIITPKMSFGTGHHATTFMMMQLMKELDFNNKTVFDFGTGTGILAILAEKLGAEKIAAIDNDDWCIENSLENIATNSCTKIHITKNNTAETTQSFNIILANINKNIIADNVKFLLSSLNSNGSILFSGLLQSDEDDILKLVQNFGVKHIKTLQRDAWIAMFFKKQH